MADKTRVLLVLQNKFGRELILVDQLSQATTDMVSRRAQTKPPNNHVEIQVKPILVNTEEQTDPTLTGVASEAEFGYGDMMASRMTKKGKKGKKKPLGLGSRSPERSQRSGTIREKSRKGSIKRSYGRAAMKHKQLVGSLHVIP